MSGHFRPLLDIFGQKPFSKTLFFLRAGDVYPLPTLDAPLNWDFNCVGLDNLKDRYRYRGQQALIFNRYRLYIRSEIFGTQNFHNMYILSRPLLTATYHVTYSPLAFRSKRSASLQRLAGVLTICTSVKYRCPLKVSLS